MSPLWILLTLLPVLGGAERFNCKGRILGAYYADAKSGCKAFHVCVRVAGGGIRDFRFFCPPGTLFHQEAQTCTDWGDDDPLACPADIYDGQFDLYKIGSGFDTRKLSSSGNRDDEAEFGLQRAETGDRRLSQNNVASNGPASDLRAAHSSDFFSGQRDRGRDESAPTSPPAPPAPSPQPRQTFRRPTTQRTQPTTQRTPPSTQYTQYTTTPTPPQPTNSPQFEVTKRKLVRKRPIYVATKASPTTFPPNTPPQQTLSEPQQNFNRRPSNQNRQYITTPNLPPQYKEYKDEYVEVSRVTPKPNRFYPSQAPSTSTFPTSTSVPQYNKKEGLVELYNYDAQSTPGFNNKAIESPVQNERGPFKIRNSFNIEDVPREHEFARKKNYNRFNNNNNFNSNVNNNNDLNNNQFNNNDLNENHNFDNNNKIFNNNDLNNNHIKYTQPTTTDYIITTRRAPNTTPAYKNSNSVSYVNEKNNFVPYSKQKYYNNPTTVSPTTTIYTTSRPDPEANLNTIAYNTNNAFQTQSTNNFADSDEDDGQYHPPSGEDDGQYKPDVYDSELLTGAHSLNIAASGNKLPGERKQYAKTQPPRKPVAQTAAPRPFRPAPTPTAPPTTHAPEPTTTFLPQTQRTFDYVKTYTTTSRPADYLRLSQNLANESPVSPTTSQAPRVPETRPTRPPTRPPQSPPAPVLRPTTRIPNSKPPNKEDSSYDYAYYDSDPGFSEYDHIEEFGKTKRRA